MSHKVVKLAAARNTVHDGDGTLLLMKLQVDVCDAVETICCCNSFIYECTSTWIFCWNKHPAPDVYV